MPSLGDIQARLRSALVAGDVDSVGALLVGGREALKRLAIHQRHYETSLITALLGKFPATVWLAGSPFVLDAARRFVREHPPHAPCIAEYGAEFPDFLSTRPAAERVPYLRSFAELEWHLSCVAVAVDHPAVGLEELSRIGIDVATDAALTLQPGLRYFHASWPVDEVMQLHLTESAPDQFVLASTEVWIEIRGARGVFRLTRLDVSEFVFRRAVLEGRSVGDAAEDALDASAGFDAGRALTILFGEKLVTGIVPSVERGES